MGRREYKIHLTTPTLKGVPIHDYIIPRVVARPYNSWMENLGFGIRRQGLESAPIEEHILTFLLSSAVRIALIRLSSPKISAKYWDCVLCFFIKDSHKGFDSIKWSHKLVNWSWPLDSLSCLLINHNINWLV